MFQRSCCAAANGVKDISGRSACEPRQTVCKKDKTSQLGGLSCFT